MVMLSAALVAAGASLMAVGDALALQNMFAAAHTLMVIAAPIINLLNFVLLRLGGSIGLMA